MKYPKLRELKEAIKALIKGPYTTKFPYEPHIPEERFRGRPIFYKDDCVGCGACFQVCPALAIKMTDDTSSDKPMRKLVVHYDNCIFCGQCQANCITEKGIMLSNEYDMATFDRSASFDEVEKEIILCEDCKEIIGAKDHILYLAKKLGHLAYANPLMILSVHEKLELKPMPAPAKLESPLLRGDMFRILCPKCRREVLLVDEWAQQSNE